MKSCQSPNIAATLIGLTVFSFNTSHADVVISGLDDRLEKNVRLISPLATVECDAARWRVDRLFRDADQPIVSALRALGYYEAEIEKTLSFDEDCWRTTFAIQPGEAVRLRTVDVSISGDAERDKEFLLLIDSGRPQLGDVFDHGKYAEFKASILRASTNAGYFDAKFDTSQVAIDKEARAADLKMEFAAGQKYHFGDVSFTEGILRDRILQGYTDIHAGDPYSASAINELYAALNGSSYFASVSIKTDPLDEIQKLVPVTVELQPAKRRVFSIGAGFSTDLGPNGRVGYTNRRINDRGHQFESKIFGSQVKSELNASYRWPKRDPRYEWFSIVSGIQHEDTDTSEQDSFKLGFQRTKSLENDWLQTRYVDYTYEDFVIGDQQSTSQLVIVGSNWEIAKGRALSRALNGYRLSIDVRGASDALGSDTSFLQLRTNAKWLKSIGERTRFIARASLGMTTKDTLSELPASVRFFAGGDSSVRGYDFETLGPVNVDGDVTGGSHQLDLSLEVDRLIRDRWAVAAFVDSGDAFDQTDIKWNTGVGVGVRWYSPVGPIRVDFAHPLDNPDEDFRVHISLGPDQ